MQIIFHFILQYFKFFLNYIAIINKLYFCFNILMSNFNKINITEAIERLKDFLGLKTDSELSVFLGVALKTVSTWKYRNSIDIDLITTKCSNISLDWILLGVDNTVVQDDSELKKDYENIWNENIKLRKDNSDLKKLVTDLKETIIDLSLKETAKKRESNYEYLQRDTTAAIVK